MTTTVLDRSTLTLNGGKVARIVDLDQAITQIRMVETITGASTLTIDCNDAHRKLLQLTEVTQASKAVLDGAGFSLVRVNKSGSTVTLEFEDIAVAALRRRTKPRKVAAGKMSRVAFCRMLVREEPWIKVVAPSAGPRSLVELGRGTVGEVSSGDAPENTWEAVGRILADIGWRAYARRGVVYFVPDSYLLKQAPYKVRENAGGVDEINFDLDIGKPAATASFTCRVGRLDLLAGSAVSLSGLGPANGAWIVETIERDPSSLTANVSLIRPRPVLAEPKASTGNAGEGGYTSGNLGGKSTGTATTGKTEEFVQWALAQHGKAYVWGEDGPNAFDCSGLVMKAAASIGVKLPHNSGAQFAALSKQGKAISVSKGIATRGALLFRGPGQHVVISLGNGNTIEAMGRAYGVVIGGTKGRGWTQAAVL